MVRAGAAFEAFGAEMNHSRSVTVWRWEKKDTRKLHGEARTDFWGAGDKGERMHKRAESGSAGHLQEGPLR